MFWQIVVFQVLFFLVLIGALHQLYHGHVTGAMQRINKLQEKNQKKEEELQKYQEKTLRECDEKSRRAGKEIETERQAAQKEIEALRENAARKIEETKEELQAEFKLKEKAMENRLGEEARLQGGRIACDIIQSALIDKMREALHRHLTEELLDSLARLKDENVTWSGGQARVSTAFALSPDQKERLKKCILACRSGASAPVEIIEESDNKLIGGFVLSLGQLLYDGSLKNKFERLAKAES